MLSYEIVKDTEIFQELLDEEIMKAKPKIIDEAKPFIESDILIKQLQLRFKKLPKKLVNEIKSLNSTEKIEKLLSSIFDFQSVEDVSNLLKKLN